MKRIITTLLLLCICSLTGYCGINRTLNEAQRMYQNATSVQEYQKAKQKFVSARTDVGYVKAEHEAAINEGIRKCDRRINELSPRLTVNGSSSTTSISLPSSSGSRTLTISTNQGTPNATALPSWISVSSASSTAMTIHYDANSSTTARTDWFYVNAGSRQVRVNVDQAGKTPTSDTYLTVDRKNAVRTSFTGSGGSEVFYVQTDARSWNTWGIPSWCRVTDVTSTSFKLICEPNTSTSSRSDYMKIKTDSHEVRIDISQGGKTSSDTYLKVDNQTSVTTSYTSSGGSKTFSVSTDADSWTTWGIPSWCTVTNKTATSFTIVCDPNRTTSSRSDYMKIKTDKHEVRIDISQAGKPGASATIDRLWVEHNVRQGFVNGMKIHINLSVYNYKDNYVKFCVFFYQPDNQTKLVNFYGQHISTSQRAKSKYDSCEWADWWIFVPYPTISSALNAYGNYSFDVEIQTDGGSALARHENVQFSIY